MGRIPQTQIYQLLGQSEKAANTYERVLQILKDDWQITEGETVEGYLQNIQQLQV